MRKKVLCIAIALVMCMLVTVPSFAENSSDVTTERALITATFGLTHVSGSTYRMWAKISNPQCVSVAVALTLYNASYTPVASINTASSNSTINMGKNVILSSGTYHLRLTYIVDGSAHSFEKTYTI